MKALFVAARGGVELREVEAPSPGEGEVLVRMKCCGVCGTDLEKASGEALTSSVLGHEVVGEVAEVGKGVTAVEVGERVFTHHHTPCYSCALCKRGEYTLCEDFGRYNLSPCGFAESYVVPRWNVERGAVVSLPEGMSYEVGSFIEPLGCCIRGLERVGASSFSSALVYGAGPVGLLHLKLLLQHHEVKRVGVADVSESRLSFAGRMGATCTFDPSDSGARRDALAALGGAPDLVVVATGSAKALHDALMTAAKGATILLFGAPAKGSSINLDLGPFFMEGLRMVASYSTSEKETARAVRILRDSLDVTDLITHRFPLEHAAEAFEAARRQRCIKALVCCH